MNVGTAFHHDELGWRVLLLGGASGVGKSTIAKRLGQRLGMPWLQVDDFRLALERMGWPVPDSGLVSTFDGTDSLVEVANLLAPAIEVVIENHVDQRNPAIIEGDGIVPALFERPSVQDRTEGGWVRALFLYEPEEPVIYENMQARAVGRTDAAHVHKNWLYGEWLRQEAEVRGIPTLPVRPWDTLEDRILNLADAPLALAIQFPDSPEAVS